MTQDEAFKLALEEMEVVKRQSVVYKLYGQKHKNIMVSCAILC